MCGPRRSKEVLPDGPYTLQRPSDDLRDNPILEPEPYYQSYKPDPEVHPTFNNMNEELQIKRKQAQGFTN